MAKTLRAQGSAEFLPRASPWEAGNRVPVSVPLLKAIWDQRGGEGACVACLLETVFDYF